MMYFIQLIESTFGNFYSLLAINSVSLFLKITLLVFLIKKTILHSKINRQWLLLLLVLIGGSFSDSAWILKLLSITFLPSIDYRLVMLWIRVSWIFSIIQHQSLALFIESLVNKQQKYLWHQKLFICCSCIPIVFFAYFIIFHFQCLTAYETSIIEKSLQRFTSVYLMLALIPASIICAFWNFKKNVIPVILRKQFKILITSLILPQLFSEFLQLYPVKAFYPSYIANSYAIVGVSTLLLTFALYFCVRKIMGMRFLNFADHVQTQPNFYFIDGFKSTLTQLSKVTNIRELHHINQHFFKETLHIPSEKSKLFIYTSPVNEYTPALDEDPTIEFIETFISTADSQQDIIAHLRQERIIIFDEIDFTNFYNQDNCRSQILKLLEAINADVLLPVYDKDRLLAYIVIERHARCHELYNATERDEMIIFASFLGNIINLLQSKSFNLLIEQEHRLKEELYHKHQEINQYKESLRSFLRHSSQKQLGIIFYKNRHFTLSNQAAKEMVDVNINLQDGHPLTQTFKQVARNAQDYKTQQSAFVKNGAGQTLVITAIPYMEQNTVIITIAPPCISDIVKKQIDMLQDPTEWDYLLYLETTKTGQLINQLIPGSGEKLLNFKIELLKLALSDKAILLDVPPQDIQSITELLHHISMRTKLHVFTINAPSTNFDIAIKLFGINPIFNNSASHEQPLFEKLSNRGTLLINNIHWLDLETQEYLADYLKYGMYNMFKSDHKLESSVRIICYSDQNIYQLTHDKKFSAHLYDQLKHTTLTMPSLFTLPELELKTLTEGYTEQAISNPSFKNFLRLSERETIKLTYKRPTSLTELKSKVQQVLMQKSKNYEIADETPFDPAYLVSDPDLVEAARLGKKALKDRKIMFLLWEKFNKNQNQISTFLGVNRSSVNRRVKEYNLQ